MNAKNKNMVSIICLTYNQEKYIVKAIESMLMQQTDFEYEIIIHDDASTDSTVNILREYQSKYPEKIRLVLEKQNQYSMGRDTFADLVRNIATGKYIAVCEGDDFWIDDNKLQLQYDAMNEHLKCDMCACTGCTVSEDGEKQISLIRPQETSGVLDVRDVILGGGQFLVTAGLFFRKKMYETMLPFENVFPLDYTMQIKGSLRGGIYYIDKNMAAYRRYAGGSWTNNVLNNDSRLRQQWEREIAMLKQLDADTCGKYSQTIACRLKSYTPFEMQLASHRDEILKELKSAPGKAYIWGRGRRGRSLEAFCAKEGIKIEGICDIINTDIGHKSESGSTIITTDEVLQNADVIFASNRYAYRDLKKSEYQGRLIDFEKYMPWG